MDALTPLLALLAGVLTVLSPCVLPILPILFGSASNGHRMGPAALALGVATAFTVAGLLLATVGFAAGLDGDALRPFFGMLVATVGLVMLVPVLGAHAGRVLAPVAAFGSRGAERVTGGGLAGQFGLGALLGLVWSPCVGPTLGAASLLASRGEQLGSVALIMVLFGLGAAAPLLAIGLASRDLLARMRGGLIAGGAFGRRLMGGGMLIIGLLTLTGIDRQVEASLLTLSPDALTELTTRF